MKALVTGGAGFIGSHVIQALLDRQADVLALDDLSGGFEENIPDGARFVRGSIVDSALVERLFAEEKFDYVFHLAAYAAEGLSHFIREFNYTNNVVGSMSVINACVRHPVSRWVFTSSIAVYGANQVPMLEETVPAPEDPYGMLARRRNGSGRRPAHVRSEFHRFPPPQRVRRTAEHWRPLSQRDRHLHEPDHARRTPDRFRRRRTAATFSHIDDVAPPMVEAAHPDPAGTRCTTLARTPHIPSTNSFASSAMPLASSPK